MSNALERALVLSVYRDKSLLGKIRKVPAEAWADPYARDLARKLSGNHVIMPEDAVQLGQHGLARDEIDSAVASVLQDQFWRDNERWIDETRSAIAVRDRDRFERAIGHRPRDLSSSGYETLAEIGHEVLQMARDAADGVAGSGGVPCPYPTMHQALGGFMQGSVHVFAGEPGGGKSALLEQFVGINARKGIPFGFISRELPKALVYARLAQHSFGPNVGPAAISSGTADVELLGHAMKELNALPIYVDDSPQTIVQAVEAAHTIEMDAGPAWYGWDFAQAFSPLPGEGEVQAQKNVIMGVYNFAKLIRKPSILISQMNKDGRRNSTNIGERPRGTDLEGSGALEQLVHSVTFLYAPVVVQTAKSAAKQGQTRVVYVDKNRNGQAKVELGVLPFDGAYLNLRWT